MKKTISIGIALLLGTTIAWVTRESPSKTSDRGTEKHDAHGHSSRSQPRDVRPPPTRLVISGTKPLVSTDPSEEDYDAVQRALVLDEAPEDIFRSEPRKDCWAPAFEANLKEHLLGISVGLFEEMTLSAECRTASCSVTVRAPGQLEEIGEFLGAYAPVGEVVSSSWGEEDGERLLVLTGLLPPKLLEFSEFEAWSAEHRRLREERIRRLSEQ